VRPLAAALLAAAVATVALPARAQAPIDAAPLPLARERAPASVEECAVWRRELAFARAVEAHDARAWESFLHEGSVFNAGTVDADRGRPAVMKSWAGIVEGRTIALRWRPGIVDIGGEPTIAVSRGPYILQRVQDGAATYRVGLFQSVWVKGGDGTWRVLFDGGASTPQAVGDRAAADRWVEEQPMSACAP
jgi:ketosteroid isomerase-like protein